MEQQSTRYEGEPKINQKVEIVSSPEKIIASETKRVKWYLDNLSKYEEMGYPLNLPKGLTSESSMAEIENAIISEYKEREQVYKNYSETLQRIWKDISKKVLPQMKKLYGIGSHFSFKLVPTAYGTGGGSLPNGNEIYFKIPEFSPMGSRPEKREVYGMVHEVLCHEATGYLREGTPIDDSIYATHHFHKERLMDLLGRTLIVRAGLMDSQDVFMDEEASSKTNGLVDILYYQDPINPDENELKYEGNLKGLITELVRQIKL